MNKLILKFDKVKNIIYISDGENLRQLGENEINKYLEFITIYKKTLKSKYISTYTACEITGVSRQMLHLLNKDNTIKKHGRSKWNKKDCINYAIKKNKIEV